jgi:hypothetical protein
VRILLWHVHGGWTDAFVRGGHDYLVPATPDGGEWGLGRDGRDWPQSVHEISPESLRDAQIDLVVLQRPAEIAEAERLLGRRVGTEVPAVYVEHNAPRGDVPNSMHPLADRDDIRIVHVTYFNALMWDNGRAPTVVIEHGVLDPGYLYTGELPELGVVINDAVRRWRVTGTDLLPLFADAAPIRLFGIGASAVPDALGLSAPRLRIGGDLPTADLHASLARCRAYLHPLRWTSLGLSLIEAMLLGMPVLVLGTTEASRAVPPEAGIVSNDLTDLIRATRRMVADPDEARSRGRAARDWALQHYGLPAFLERWDAVIGQAASAAASNSVASAKTGPVGTSATNETSCSQRGAVQPT